MPRPAQLVNVIDYTTREAMPNPVATGSSPKPASARELHAVRGNQRLRGARRRGLLQRRQQPHHHHRLHHPGHPDSSRSPRRRGLPSRGVSL